MIQAHQPTIFPANVRVAVSSTSDGSMKAGDNPFTPESINNRERFIATIGTDVMTSTVFFASFAGDNYCRYQQASKPVYDHTDAVSTEEYGRALIVPLADCTGAVLYDPEHHALMVSHLGRHSTEQFGAVRSVEYMTKTYGSRPEALLVWMGPSPDAASYPLWKFDNRGFKEVLHGQFISAGIAANHIEVSCVDTSSDTRYFSHSEFLRGNRDEDGRYALVAMLTE